MNEELERAYKLLKDSETNIREARQIMIRELPDVTLLEKRISKEQTDRIYRQADKIDEALTVFFKTDFLRPLKWKTK